MGYISAEEVFCGKVVTISRCDNCNHVMVAQNASVLA